MKCQQTLMNELKVKYFLETSNKYILYENGSYFYISYQFDYGLMGGERTHGIAKEDFRILKSNPEEFREVIYYKYMVDEEKFPVDFPRLKKYSEITREIEPFIVYEIEGHYFLLVWEGRISEVQIAKHISQIDFEKLMCNEVLPSQIVSI
ncbi:hypothetical protein G9F32_09770 [Acinetobacter sp. 194]|uniref:hypothetical protein n=1 Tax=Acinetobacter shaoyimingii TaxID=2715164 RepID=UPI00140D5BD9|nr:hypothetical protein [Acinetobacter shaoyimingii]NHB58304.1 hypothetical protein [Acinetobacter shaoyimingii]